MIENTLEYLKGSMKYKEIYADEFFGKLKSNPLLQGTKDDIREKVVQSFLALIPKSQPLCYIKSSASEVIALAILKFCSVESVNQIDYLGITTLAANICKLLEHSGWLTNSNAVHDPGE